MKIDYNKYRFKYNKLPHFRETAMDIEYITKCQNSRETYWRRNCEVFNRKSSPIV